ncbi:flagellar biosynthesis protein FlhB [Oribacterium sp. WCC10]|uniref:flagellar biosynthesis protein FlhB n=1 Tax=Oribacterium sp. WCC10 TaxID=1855343 RepID=UPI0008E19664|nr:flagellar biosynthesis protein FlhB [Oribacterium sp. WCC10]SFG24822.1 flagellar biosynthetic protein FlhB [Oribacterium sp. WCC10]
MGDDGADKTEEPTAHKISEARKEGNVCQSKDVATVVMLLGVFVMVRIMIPTIYRYIISMLRYILDCIAHSEYNPIAGPLFYRFILYALVCSLPILLVAVILAILSHGVQTKFNYSKKATKVKFSKLNPLSGIKKVFSLSNSVEVLKNMLKISILIVLLIFIIKDKLLPIARMLNMAPFNATLLLLSFIWDLILRVALAFSVIAFLDYLYQRYKYHKDLMMTKQEVKDESKMIDGNPEVKNKMKQKHREMTNRRMMQEVPQADVIVRNPTHVAVALKYDPDRRGAPYVVAKGLDLMALKIVETGEKNDVPWIENKPLARALYASCEIGQEIPVDYYSAVAEILVYIYRQKHGELPA